jgi:hypothetical protein
MFGKEKAEAPSDASFSTPVNSPLLLPNTLLSSLFQSTHNLHYVLSLKGQISRPNETTNTFI